MPWAGPLAAGEGAGGDGVGSGQSAWILAHWCRDQSTSRSCDDAPSAAEHRRGAAAETGLPPLPREDVRRDDDRGATLPVRVGMVGVAGAGSSDAEVATLDDMPREDMLPHLWNMEAVGSQH